MTQPAPGAFAGLSREEKARLFKRLQKRREEGRIPRRPPGLAPLPLSFAQERLWFLDRMQPGSSAYNMLTALAFHGDLSPALLESALSGVAERHESLRTTFRDSGGQSEQVIAPPARVAPRIADLAILPPEIQDAEARRLVAEEAARPFDLERGPLLRATLIRLGKRPGRAGQILLFNMHHIVSDGWSMGVLVQEVLALYRAAEEERPSPLPELPIQYADFALWQRRWLEGDVLERQLGYWRERLADAPAALELPADRPRPAVQSFRGGAVSFRVGPEVTRQLNVLSRRHEVTLFMALLAAFQTLLHRLTGQPDLPVGSPIANRSRSEIAPLIGFFVNTLVLRSDLAGDPTFEELLGQVRATALAAYSHQDLPFERLVEELRPERHLSHSPLFQVLCTLQNASAGTSGLSGLAAEAVAHPTTTAKFDLEVAFNEAEDRLGGTLVYNADLFDPPSAWRLVGQLQVLLSSVAEGPERHLSHLPLLTPAERHQLLVEWNDTRLALPGDEDVLALFAAQVARAPEAPAIVCGGECLTYGELDRRADTLAHRLRAAGVGPEVAVGLCLERTAGLAVGMLGIWKAGGAYVPLDPGLPSTRLAFLLEDSAVPVLVTRKETAGGLPPHGAATICLEECGERNDGPPPGRPAAGDLAYMIYTSGTTGQPKAVMVEHGQLASTLAAVRQAFGFDSGDRMPCVAPFSFDIFLFELLAPLLAGGVSVLLPLQPTLDVERLVDELREATRLHAVPALMRQVVEAARRRSLAAPRLRALFVGGDVVPPELLADLRANFPRARVHVLYGPTEATIVCTAWTAPADGTARSLLGRPLANARIDLRDAAGHPVPIGAAGEIWIGGSGVSRGYWRRPELTAERFIEVMGERFFRSGDRARRLQGGALEFLGRADEQVKVRGFRIELGEIESALARHPEVQEAVATVRDDAAGGRQLVAYVVCRSETEATATPAELRRLLLAELPDYMVPTAFVLLDALPLTAHGKVDRAALPAPELFRRAEATAPRTPLEEILAELWCDLLGLPQVGVEENFFELGGHSLLAGQVVSRLRQRLDVELPVRVLFEEPTIAGLAARIESESHTAMPAATIRPVSRDQPGNWPLPLSFEQERMWFLHQLDPASAAYNLSTPLRLRGDLRPALLEATLHTVVRRHESLRTTFPSLDGRPYQEIHPVPERVLREIDLRALPPAAREAELRRRAREQGTRPFDLARGPLLRSVLVRLAEDEGALLLATHHIVSDGWSTGVLVREVAETYGSLLRGRSPELPELPVQYADFAVWQRQWLAGEGLERALSYWRQRLAGEAPVLRLPADHARPPMPSGRGATARTELPPAAVAALEALARGEGATTFMAGMAVFVALLTRYTGQEDVWLGSPIANRDRAEVQGLIGVFVNTLVLRTETNGGPNLRELVRRSRETALGAYGHQDLPFERLVEELRPERDPSRTPLFQVMYALQNAPTGALELPSLEVSPVPAGGTAVQFDLSLFLWPAGEGLLASFDYSRDLFDPPTIERMGGHFRALLTNGVAHPTVPFWELPMLSEAEQRQLTEWNAETRPAAQPERTLFALFAAQAERTPAAVAVIAAEERLTYADLAGRATRLAARLRRLGVGPEVPVAVCLPRSADLIAALLAVLEAGGFYVPLDPAYPADRLSFLLADSGARIVVTNESLAGRLPEHEQTVFVNEEGEGVEKGATVLPGHLAYLIYTSGSTGRPKAVAVENRSAVLLAHWAREVFSPAELSGVLASTSLAFDLSVFEIFVPLAWGGTVILADDALALPSLLAAGEVRLVNTVPSVLAELLRSGGLPTGVTTVNLAGEALPGGLARRIYERPGVERLYNLYGPSEDTTYSTWALVERDGGREPAIGRPVRGTSAYVVDSRLGIQPVGVPGELCLGGGGLARGYFGRPELTAERFVPDPFAGEQGSRMYRTGDLARRRPDSVLEYLGRLDQQVKVRGFRIELGEVEATLSSLPGVEAAAVLVREERPGDRRLVAWLSPTDLQVSTLRDGMRRKLPDFMVPSVWHTLDALPRTPTGKLDRRALLASGREPATAATGDHVPPRMPIEEGLAGIWREILGTDAPIGAFDDFFTLGGHSLLGGPVLARVRDLFQVELPLRALFEEPTLAGLAARIERERRMGGPVSLVVRSREVLVRLQEGAPERRPLFCVHPVGGEVACFRELARRLGSEQPLYGLRSPEPEGRPLTDLGEMAALYLDAVHDAQPTGPYRLAGWSMGGVVAYEMARQLSERGETVELLALLDTLSPQWWAEQPHPDDVELVAWLALDLARLFGLTELPTVSFDAPDVHGNLAQLLAIGHEMGVLSPALGLTDLRRLFEVFRANYLALFSYPALPYPGPLLLFRPAGGMEDGRYDGWADLAAGGVIVHAVPADHYSLVLGEAVEQVAAPLRELLGR